MSTVNVSQLCVPVSSLAQAAAAAADVSEGKLINLDTSSQTRFYLLLILPLKLEHTWEFTHLLSRSSTSTQTGVHVVRVCIHTPMPLFVVGSSKTHMDKGVAADMMNKIQGAKLAPCNQSCAYTYSYTKT